MASEENAAHLLFKENNKDDFLAASELLLRLANNVLENPNENKYRRIRLANPLLEAKLLPFVGGMECLFEMGFQEDGEYLVLPGNSSLRVLRQVRDELTQLRTVAARQSDSATGVASESRGADAAALAPEKPSSGQESRTPSFAPRSQQTTIAAAADARNQLSSSAVAAAARSQTADFSGGAATTRPRPIGPAVRTPPAQTVEALQRQEADFMRRIRNSMSLVMLYEDLNLQEKARTLIPITILREEAEAGIRSHQQSPRRDWRTPDLQDYLLLGLLDWFKNSFFKWVDSPPCDSCGDSTHHVGSVNLTPAEEMWGGTQVENHQCDTCGEFTRFPRYNHPGKLLETRRGRCGEWANCFTLCCRALGFEARYILDWTDHVWTEVYSNSQKRWLHCDPCENVCDKPLLYEKGWGKKLTYILAFSKDEIQDVTWRYSVKHAEILNRRKECRESWLLSVVHNLFNQKLQTVTEARKQELLQRLVVELVEFLTIKTERSENLPGRTTGSLGWRQSRGELGQRTTTSQQQYVFRLLEEEKHSEVVHIKYSCAQDVYIRVSTPGVSVAKWHSCSNSLGMFRKEERDWKMTYLARDEDAITGQISWKFDLTGEDLRIDRLELKATSAVFEDGVVQWKVCCDDLCFPVSGQQLMNFKTFELDGGKVLTVTAVLSGGQGDNAWQHAQLFRQSLQDSEFPFELVLHLG